MFLFCYLYNASHPLFWFTIPEGFYALVTRHRAHDEYVDSKGKKSPVWLYVFCIAPLMHTSFCLMVRGPAIQHTHLLRFSFNPIEIDEGSKAINIIAFKPSSISVALNEKRKKVSLLYCWPSYHQIERRVYQWCDAKHIQTRTVSEY